MSPKLKITLIQSYLFWEDPQKNLQQFSIKINSLNQRTDLIVLPEMFNTGFSMRTEKIAEAMNGPTVSWMKKTAEKTGSVITGSLAIAEDGKIYNRLVWMRPDGSHVQYDKKHLFSMYGENEHFTPGENKLVVDLNGWLICPMICYDLRFPVWCRNLENYHFMLFVANWPEKRVQHWRTLLQARAIENQCYVLGVNRVGDDGGRVYHSGDSMLLHPMGNILFQKMDEEDIYTATLQKEELEKTRRALPFLEDADEFTFVSKLKNV